MLVLYNMAAKGKPIVAYGNINYQDVFIKNSIFVYVFKLSVGP